MPQLRNLKASLLSIPLCAALGIALATTMGDARADDAGTPDPNKVGAACQSQCGKFDFSAGFDCKISVSGGCTANCTPLKFEAACSGGCTATPIDSGVPCVDTCGQTCVAQCNPAALDCFVGFHKECDQPTQDICNKDTN